MKHAESIASRLASTGEKPEIVYASPFLRTTETAHRIAKACNCSVRIEEGLTEWQTPSLLVGETGERTNPLSTPELADRFDTVERRYKSQNPVNEKEEGSPQFPESEDQLLRRCRKTMQRILQDAGDFGSLAIVSHAPCDQGLAFFLEGADTPEQSQLTPWPLGGITHFRGNSLVAYGDTSHMPGIYRDGIKQWSLPCLQK